MHSMTTSATQLSHIFDKISTQITRREVFLINLDYESWCNAFRPELQQPLCEELDRMFLSGCFHQVGSWLPALMTFIMQDRFNPPAQDQDGFPIEDGEACLQGSLTMGEGMRQKLWTIITACLELLSLEELELKGDILGQGDNQTIIVSVPLYAIKDEAKDLLLSKLIFKAHEARLTLKPDECWVSDVIYEYGKRLYFNGVPIPSFLKIFSRLTDSTGEIYSNIYSRLTCLSSSCLSASQVDYTPWPSVIAGILVYVMEIFVLFPSQICSDPHIVSALAVVGPVLGGLSSPATLPSVMFRGLADPLTFQLSLLKTTITTGIAPLRIHQVTKLTVPAQSSALALCSDPTCLNIVPIRRPEGILKIWIEE